MRMKIRRHYSLLVALALVAALLTLGIGDTRIIAYTVPGSQATEPAGSDIAGPVDLFDDSVVHSVRVVMDDADYQAMVSTYQQTGEKDYFHGDVIIDGVTISDVGIRLKGNASLRTALGGSFGGQRGPGAAQPGGERVAPPEGGQLPARPNRQFPGLEDGELPQLPEGGELPAFPGGFQPGGQGGQETDQIPLMIKFDEFVTGQTYQGYDRFAIRSAGVMYDASMLQEPVTNSVLRLVGLPATATAYAGVRLNDEDEQLFTISEVVEQDYLDQYFANAGGILYKAEVNATMTYQGDDPSAYSGSFTQETRVNDADLGPLIDFLKFVTNADDATFESELPARLDVDSFAAYLAVNNLLVNTDSMIGMGNNFYMYYDEVAERFTVLMWDGNESLGKLTMMGGRQGEAAGGSDSASFDINFQNTGSVRGPMMGRSSVNSLLTRFLANPTFKALYEQKVEQVYQAAFESGAILRQIDDYTSVVRAANAERSLVDADAYNQAVASVIDFINRRAAYLASTDLLSR